jgi:hypothetical protein
LKGGQYSLLLSIYTITFLSFFFSHSKVQNNSYGKGVDLRVQNDTSCESAIGLTNKEGK